MSTDFPSGEDVKEMQGISPAVEDGLHEAIKEIGTVDLTGQDRTVVVGDLDSDERGSGARMNADKPKVDMIPVRCWLELFKRRANTLIDVHGFTPEETGRTLTAIQALGEFQEQRASGAELLASMPASWYDMAVEVFEYGAKKYKLWNWLKGQQWSVPMACAIRHMQAIFIKGELRDPESGLTHIGHFMCNIIMLATFYDTFPEGNDLPREEYFRHGK
jgi:hypothetical protein